jgi:ABC-type Co2+ transport system permease subunit
MNGRTGYMAFRLGKISRTSVARGSAAMISAFALLCAAATPAGAAPPLIPLPPVLQGPVFSATATSIPVGGAPSAIATGDLIGDGQGSDVVVTNDQLNSMTLFRRDTAPLTAI